MGHQPLALLGLTHNQYIMGTNPYDIFGLTSITSKYKCTPTHNFSQFYLEKGKKKKKLDN